MARRFRLPRRWRLPVFAVAVLAVLGCGIWLGVRAYLAQHEMADAERLAREVQQDIVSGRPAESRAAAAQLVARVDAAKAYTSDPVWRAAGLIPWVGGNFSIPTRLAEVLSDVAHGAVEPASSAAADFDLSKLKPVNGGVDLKELATTQTVVDRVDSVLRKAHDDVAQIRSGLGVIAPLSDGVERLTAELSKVSNQVEGANRALQLLPPMLGNDGARNYLILFLNNAELRSTGGIPGSVALIHVDHGHISLAQQTEAKGFPAFAKSVLPLAPQTEGLYGSITGRYFQDVNLTPQFDVSARVAAEMWRQKYGTTVDGVFSLDPVALSFVLKATGPVMLPTGGWLDSENAIRALLSDAYAHFDSVADKDGFFASVAAAVFAKVVSGGFDPKAMAAQLGAASAERRVLAWSSRLAEQEVFEAAGISGDISARGTPNGGLRVYLNDATGAKMDYYLRVSYRVGGVACRADGRPNWEIEVTFKNEAPADAAHSLPEYVTGGGLYGVPPGDMKTQVNAYALPGSVYLGAQRDGAHIDLHTDMDAGYAVAQTDLILAPGQSSVLRFQFLGPAGAKVDPPLVVTPTVNTITTSPLPLSCDDKLG
ncbi:DUF4012 domain-containing protein [Sinomonas sp. ASV322]|uniref:DUF4012 domain-containing protein n=1 Tax=Sinomonas sp. ASV322 TaxID=3041920 RepID=UPI0027DC2231|nr:DUF4012 domain-containing protein [Sinomonas sp. ASV322]MDQ4502984.1 DUF4012 domain-containing protein [Sinomonas sp. ASV322]